MVSKKTSATSVRSNIATLGIAAVAALSLASTPAKAGDSTWACEVALCASNPGGWMQFTECVKPIKKLIRHLATGGGFPTCSAGGFKSADYKKPKFGRPGYVTFTKNDGSKVTYRVPSEAEVYAAEGGAATSPIRPPLRGNEVEQ